MTPTQQLRALRLGIMPVKDIQAAYQHAPLTTEALLETWLDSRRKVLSNRAERNRADTLEETHRRD